MRAIRFERPGGPEVLQYVDIDLPEPGPGEVRVRHHAIGVNYIDTYYRSGLYAVSQWPSGLGTEAAGVVEAVGSEVDDVAVGDAVAYATGPLGAYAEARCIPAAHLVPIPPGVSFVDAAALLLKGLTVQYLFCQTHCLHPGEAVLFQAASGGVGSLACQWARAIGARLIATVSGPERAEKALAQGAWAAIDTSRENVAERVLELTEGRKCPVVYDPLGKSGWLTSLACVAPRGLIVSFGNTTGPVRGVDLGELAAHGSIFVTRPVLGHYADTPAALRDMAQAVWARVETGELTVEIGQRFALADAACAHVSIAERVTHGVSLLIPESTRV